MSAITKELERLVSSELLKKFQEAIEKGIVKRMDIEEIRLLSGEILNPDRVEIRRLKDMKGVYSSDEAWRLMDPETVVYRVHRKSYEELFYGVTEILPGKVGDEYFMTKGHFHQRVGAPGICVFLAGRGAMVLQHQDEKLPFMVAPVERGTICYEPGYYAHRAVNLGPEKLIYVSIAATDSGWDYGLIEKKGLRYLIVEKQGKATIMENPRYSKI